MTRWIQDVVFFRVTCVTLLAAAFMFAVVLTNVFIDIDGYLMIKNRDTKTVFDDVPEAKMDAEIKPEEFLMNDSEDSEDEDSIFRTRRSLDSKQKLTSFKNTNLKNVLTNQLAVLLEQLDEDPTTSSPYVTGDDEGKPDGKDENQLAINGLHHSLHNILLEGITGHKNLEDIYRRIKEMKKAPKEVLVHDNKQKSSEEDKLLEEVIRCRELEEQIVKYNSGRRKEAAEESTGTQSKHKGKYLDWQLKGEEKPKETSNEKDNDLNMATKHWKKKNKNKQRKVDAEMGSNQLLVQQKGHNTIVKAVIEIRNENDKPEQNNTNGNVNAFITLIYNGKSINLTQMQNDSLNSNKNTRDIEEVTKRDDNINEIKDMDMLGRVLRSDTGNKKHNKDNDIVEFLKRYSQNKNMDSEEIKKNKLKRNKRQINVDHRNTTIPKYKIPYTKDDDKHIDIEIDFDENAVDGDKRKKIINKIIQNIKIALTSTKNLTNNSNVRYKGLHFKKRSQEPIVDTHITVLEKKMSPPFDKVKRRDVIRIDKILNDHESIINKFGDVWHKHYSKPNFLTASKAVNSAEMGEVHIAYDEILKDGILKRLQKPISDNTEEENDNPSDLFTDLGNLTLLLKNIDNSGLAVGYNQFIGNAPDKDSLIAFHGVENFLKEYSKKYDVNEIYADNSIYSSNNYVQPPHEISKRETEKRRHIVKNLPLKTSKHYIYNLLSWHKKPLDTNQNRIHKTNLDSLQYLNLYKPIIINENFSKKSVYPTIFSDNNLSIRKKRSVNIQKFTNLKSKLKINRYINTNLMAKKKLFLRKQRNKRQIEKVSFVTEDRSSPYMNSPEEETYLISPENTFSNRASLTKESKIQSYELYDTNNNMRFADIYNVPKIHPIYSINPFQGQLMSRYPHVFIDTETKEVDDETFNDNFFNKGVRSARIRAKPLNMTYTKAFTTIMETTTAVPNEQVPGFDEILNAVIPKSHFKVTLKILPKRNDTILIPKQTTTNTKIGFKEFHTSLNKSFEKDGLHYYSLVNVSEISKIEKLNHTSTTVPATVTTEAYITKEDPSQNVQRKLSLKKQQKKVDEQLINMMQENTRLGNIIYASVKGDTGLALTKYPVNSNYRVIDIRDNIGNNNIQNKIREKILMEQKLKSNDNELEIMKSIKRNENITGEVLKRIDSNTNVLQFFLGKLFDKIDNISDHVDRKIKTPFEHTSTKPTEVNNEGLNKNYFKNESHSANVGYNDKSNNHLPVVNAVSPSKLYANPLQNEVQNSGSSPHNNFLIGNDNSRPNETKYYRY